jgi:hypothetical protein
MSKTTHLNTAKAPMRNTRKKTTGKYAEYSDSSSADELAYTPVSSTQSSKKAKSARPSRKSQPVEDIRGFFKQSPASDSDQISNTSERKDQKIAEDTLDEAVDDVNTIAQQEDSVPEENPLAKDDPQERALSLGEVNQNQLLESALPKEPTRSPSPPPSKQKYATKRQARNARAKRKCDDSFNGNDDDFKISSTPSKQNVTKRTNSAKHFRYTKKWDPILAITDPKSPLAKVNLRQILESDAAWSLLTPAQQRELLTYLPRAPSELVRQMEEEMVAAAPAGEPLPNIALQRLGNSMAFKSDIRQFQEELGQGKLDVGWIEQAMMASERRKRGDFDDWKVKERENYWEMTGDHNDLNA